MFRSLQSIVLSAAAVALIGVVAVGVARAQSPASASPTSAVAAGASAAPAGPATADVTSGLALDALLVADQPSAQPEGTAARPDRAAARGDLRRLAAWRHLVHATVVVDLPQAGLTTIQLDHGSISAVDAASVTIAESGGGSVTVKLADDTRVRRDGKRAAIADLKPGDELFVMSKVEAGGTTAYLVVVPRH